MTNEVKTIRYKIKQYDSLEKSVLNEALEKIKNTPEKYPRGHGKERKNPL